MIVACCRSGLFVCINGCFMLDGFVDLVLAVFGVLVDVVGVVDWFTFAA